MQDLGLLWALTLWANLLVWSSPLSLIGTKWYYYFSLFL